MSTLPPLKDSGTRRKFESGAVRDAAVDKGRFDLIPPEFMFRLALHYERGAVKYGDHNWTKGMPWHVYLDSAIRHLYKFIAGWDDEDHLIATIWNLVALVTMQTAHPEFNDLLAWQDRVSKWILTKPKDA